MSFLNQLKSQAQTLQSERQQRASDSSELLARCEAASKTIHHYFDDLVRQLQVLEPAGPRLSLDGKTPWPAMKLTSFRCDARRKPVDGREVIDYVAIGWDILPQIGKPVGGVVTVNFPPDLERVQKRLADGWVEHERKEQRHPEKNTLLAIRFEYLTHSRGNVVATAEHATGQIAFRLCNVDGFGVETIRRAAVDVNQDLLDELAKRLVGQPSRFV